MRALAIATLSALLFCSCGKKKEQEAPIAVAPPPGAATSNELTTGIGQARGLPEGLAPATTKWRRVFVLDERRAVITGDTPTETVALLTDDGGRSWRALRGDRDAWANWSLGADGTLVMATGARDGAASVTGGTVESTRLLFAAFDAERLSPPTPLFPQPKGPARGGLQAPSAIAAALAPDSAALVGDEAPRRQAIFYGGAPGAEAAPTLPLPAAEKAIPAPFGRPPVLLSTKAKDLFARPWPAAGKPLDPPQKVAGLLATPGLFAELAAAPACEAGAWSFQRVSQPPARPFLLAVSAEKTVAWPLPEGVTPTSRVGCAPDGRVVVEAVDAKSKSPNVAICDAAGKCAVTGNAAFRLWPEKHERDIVPALAGGGAIAVLAARAGERWGIYLGQTTDGVLHEPTRIVAEGSGDRGRVDLGAVIAFPKRVVILLSADLTGTSRRGWFSLTSDDGGASWGPQ